MENHRHVGLLAPLSTILAYEDTRMSGPRKQVLIISSALLLSVISRGGRYPIEVKEVACRMLSHVVTRAPGCTAAMQQPGYAQALLQLSAASSTAPSMPLTILSAMMRT